MIYLDTSAALKLVLDESDSGLVRTYLSAALQDPDARVVSSDLLRVELARVGVRENLDPAPINQMVSGVSLVRITSQVIDDACLIPQHVRSLDALHLATARLLHSVQTPVQLLTCDTAMARVGATLGLSVPDLASAAAVDLKVRRTPGRR